MTFKTLFYAYILGGLTFIPLVLAAVLIPAWLLLPRVEDGGGTKREDEGAEKREKDDVKSKDAPELKGKEGDEGASGTFAVLRTFDFPTAIAALNARNNPAGGAAAAADGTVEAGSAGSESVYQSMYRSVFDRNKAAAANSSVLEAEDASAAANANAKARRKVTPANVFYIALRHGHLMLYDSAAQVEVRHVISLAHHSISLSEGGPPSEEEEIKDGDLFIKRTAIVLTPVELPNGQLQSRGQPPKPFYLFSTLSSEKEDFYHALLYTRSKPPIPEPLDANDAIKLQSILHSTSLTPETKALNGLLSRIFLALYHTDRAKNFVQSKVEKKISRVQKPAFIASLAVQSIDLGDSAPVLSNPRLKSFDISGDMTIACDIRYTGGVKLTISAVAKLDLGPRFKTRTADLVLATSLQRLSGHMLFRIKPPPSNRIWFTFDGMPEMDIKVEPVVSQRRISYTFILSAIEQRIRAVVAETLVRPNWDDVQFFDTRGQHLRGGIWRDEGGESAEEPTAGEMLKERNQKTKSMPVLPISGTDQDSSATSSGSENTANITSASTSTALPTTNGMATTAMSELKRRSVASLPATTTPLHSSTPTPPTSERQHAPPPPLRSPSYASSSAPSVALDESPANVDPVVHSQAQAQKRWRIRSAANHVPSRREAVDAMREVRDRAWAGKEIPSEAEAEAGVHSVPGVGDSAGERELIHDPAVDEQEGDRRISDTPSASSPAPSLFTNRAESLRSPKRTDSSLSTATTASSASNTRNVSGAQQRKNLLAATAAATTAARNWSWNALNNAKNNRRSGGGTAASSAVGADAKQPMGRGQPLPPPGMPLPGPNKGLWGGVGGLGSVKRKPVLPQRPEERREGEKATPSTSVEEISEREAEEERHMAASDEFGPWRENTSSAFDTSAEAEVKEQEQEQKHDDRGGEEDSEGVEVLSAPTEQDETAASAASKPLPSQSSEEQQLPTVKPKIPPRLPPRRQTQDHAPEPNLNSPAAVVEDKTQPADSTNAVEEELEREDAGAEEEIVAIPAPLESEEEEKEVADSKSGEVSSDGDGVRRDGDEERAASDSTRTAVEDEDGENSSDGKEDLIVLSEEDGKEAAIGKEQLEVETKADSIRSLGGQGLEQ